MEDNYSTLFDQSRRKFLTYDQREMIDWFGLDHDEENLYFRLLGEPAAVDRTTGVVTVGGEPAGFNESCPVYDILSRAGHKPKLSGEWVSIVTLGGNIASRHVETLNPRVGQLQGRCGSLRELCQSWGGIEQKQGDVSFILPFCDFFPVWLQFWDGDEEFPPQLRCLWDANTLDFMYYETTWYAQGYLIDRCLGRKGRR